MKTANKLLIIGLTAFAFVLFMQATVAHAGTVNCSGGSCWYTECQQNSDCGIDHWTGAASCQQNSVYQNYITYTCNSGGTAFAYCSSSMAQRQQTTCSSNQICQYGICQGGGSGGGSGTTQPPLGYTQHSYLKCSENSVYWFDSQNNRQSMYQACSSLQVCSSNKCVNTYTSHASRRCSDNISYWYDSLGNRQDVYKNCSLTGQSCQNGSCVGAVTPPSTPTPTQTPAYALHYVTKCSNNDIYWFDSKDELKDLFQKCSDTNSCTLDGCSEGRCSNELRCDGTTCQADSEDYLKYCATTAAASDSPFANFLKKWYIWIILALIFVFLFVIVFRRLSSNNAS